MKASEQRFSSRWGLLLSVLGIAVGTGNIWRFPRIAAQNGGDGGAGAFLVAWLVFLLVWSIPLIIAEYALGQRGRMGTIGSFAKLTNGRFAWMGAFVGFVATAIMFYYSVVAGWCVYYMGTSLFSGLPISLESAQATWDGFQGSGLPLVFHALAMTLGALACWQGVRSIERANKILVPTLLVIVVIAVVRAVTLPGAGAGIAYLFTPDWSILAEPRTWLEALTQNAWDTGAGWGLILTYGAYMQKEHGVVRNAVLTGVGNNTVSLLAATMIFGIVFAVLGQQMGTPEILATMRESGPASTGLTFIWMPQLFAQMAFGKILAVLFFLALSFAALSSLISMIELTTRNLVDLGLRRPRAVALTAGGGFLLGVPSAINLGFFANQDFVWGVALMLSGAFVAIAVVVYGARRIREEIATPSDWRLPAGWEQMMRFLIPIQAAVLLVWWLWQATTADFATRWYDPLEPYSAMTCLVQWSLVLALFIALNRWMTRRTVGGTLYEAS
ncbi:MAG: sodium-dependent transporter [Rhodothermaceae bacterium]|nr:sodium-dependent transporter [Rhodothermaceae bacterium]